MAALGGNTFPFRHEHMSRDAAAIVRSSPGGSQDWLKLLWHLSFTDAAHL